MADAEYPNLVEVHRIRNRNQFDLDSINQSTYKSKLATRLAPIDGMWQKNQEHAH